MEADKDDLFYIYISYFSLCNVKSMHGFQFNSKRM